MALAATHVLANSEPLPLELQNVMSMMRLSDLETQLIHIRKEISANPYNAHHYARLGDTYRVMKNYVEAEKAYHEARRLRLSDRQWAVPLGQVYLQRHKYIAVLDEIPYPRDWLPEDEWAQNVLLIRAQAYQKLDMLEQASKLYQAVINAAPTSGTAYFGLAKTYFLMGHSETQIQSTLAKAKVAGYEDLDGYAELVALMARRSGNWDALKEAHQYTSDMANPDPLSLLTMTYAALFQGHLDEFTHYAKRLNKALPTHPKARYLYALSRYQIDNIDEAEEILSSAIDADPSVVMPYFLLAKMYYTHDSLPLAASTLAKLNRFAPDNWNANFFLSIVYLQMGASEKALPLLQQQIEKRPSDYRLYGLMGNCHLLREDWKAALDTYSKAAQLYNQDDKAPIAVDFSDDEDALAAYLDLNSVVPIDDAIIRINAIRALRAQQDYELEKAETYAARNLIVGQDPVANYIYADTLARMDRMSQAIIYSQTAYDNAPYFVANGKLLSKLYLESDEPDKARSLVLSLFERNPKDASLHMLQAHLADKTESEAKTIDWLKSAIENAPQSPEPRLALVSYYLKRQLLPQALALTKDSYGIFPKEIQFLNTQAKIALEIGEWDEAIHAFTALEARLPGSAMMLIGLARAYEGKGEQDHALATLDSLLKQDPTDISALVFKAQLNVNSTDSAALTQLGDTILSVKPQHPMGLTLLGRANALEQKWQNAIHYFDIAFDAKPSAELVQARYEARRAIDIPEEGFSIIEAWLKENPDDAGTRRFLAQEYDRLGFGYEAILAYERLLLDEPTNVNALVTVARLYVAYDATRANDFATKAFRLEPENPVVLDGLGWVLVQSGNPKRGFDLLDKAARLAPLDLRIRYHLGFAKHKLGDVNGAKEDLSRVVRANESSFAQEQALTLLKAIDFEPQYDAGIRL